MSEETNTTWTSTQTVQVYQLILNIIQTFVLGGLAVYYQRKWDKEKEDQQLEREVQKYANESIEVIYANIMQPLCKLMYLTGHGSNFDIMYVARRHCDKLRKDREDVYPENRTLFVQERFKTTDQHQPHREASDEKTWNEYIALHHNVIQYTFYHMKRIRLECGDNTAEKYDSILIRLRHLKQLLEDTYHNVMLVSNYNMVQNYYELVTSDSNLKANRLKDSYTACSSDVEKTYEFLNNYMEEQRYGHQYVPNQYTAMT